MTARLACAALRRLALSVPLALALACAEEPPRWVHLAEGFQPVSLGGPLELGGGLRLVPSDDPHTVWAERPIPDEAWRPVEPAGVWEAPVPLDAWRRRVRLVDPTGRLERVTGRAESVPPDFAPGSFFVRKESLLVCLAEGESPVETRFQVQVPLGSADDGADGGRRKAWRGAVSDYVGDAVTLLTDRPVTLRTDVPPRSSLRFFVAARMFEVPDPAAPRKARVSVTLDGELLVELDVPVEPRAAGTWHTVALPQRGREGAEVEVRLEGVPSAGALFSPVIGPTGTGGFGARPWDDARPDLVLFLADTFRADNLAAWGGDPELAPHMNRLADASVRFLRAWSPASWTLPAQASMMTGVWPPEHGATLHQNAMSGSLTTLAEHLATHGYRTGAVTDAAYVSASFGFDQGFEWFVENRERNLVQSLRAALEFLENDDGRPTFLFFQTYRTHTPYRVGTYEDGGPWRTLMREIAFASKGGESQRDRVERREELFARFAPELEKLYRRSVRALDGQVGPFVERLERLGILDSGYLVLTSDHGEAFGEHGDMLHGGELWQEKILVPLLVRGGGLAPRDVREAATLVDLPATFASLARLPPAAGWGGRPLLELDVDRPVFAFDEDKDPAGPRVSIIEGDRKVFVADELAALGAGRVDRAFDLARDPDEERDLVEEGATWPGELCRRLAPALEAMQPLVQPEGVDLDVEDRRILQALGYGN